MERSRGHLRLVGTAPSPGEVGPEAASGWDVMPHDGPAVFVADLDALERGTVVGCWLDPRLPAAVLEQHLTAALGAAAMCTGRWAIIDQLGCGPAMLPERPELSELAALCQEG